MMARPTIALAAVAEGFELKQTVSNHLRNVGYGVVDLGCYAAAGFVMYPSVGERLAYALSNGQAELGVICCSYGSSVCAAVAKFQGVCAFASESVRTAEMCRRLNGANVLCVGQAIVDAELACEMVSAFANAAFLDMEGLPEEVYDFHREARDRLMARGEPPRTRDLEILE